MSGPSQFSGLLDLGYTYKLVGSRRKVISSDAKNSVRPGREALASFHARSRWKRNGRNLLFIPVKRPSGLYEENQIRLLT